MKGNRTMKHLMKIILVTALALFLLMAAGCSSQTSYEGTETYGHLYTESDSEQAKQLKHVIIAQINAYNTGDAEGYYALFNMEKEDYNFNVAQFQTMRQTVDLSYMPESIDTAFIDENNAQALITMVCKASDKSTGEVLYYYRTEMTYTMVRDGKWTITLQTPGSEEDLMYTLTESSTTEE